jgi:hypothetical protein
MEASGLGRDRLLHPLSRRRRVRKLSSSAAIAALNADRSAYVRQGLRPAPHDEPWRSCVDADGNISSRPRNPWSIPCESRRDDRPPAGLELFLFMDAKLDVPNVPAK